MGDRQSSCAGEASPMQNNMARITAFFDLAGRMTRATEHGSSHLTVAGVAIPTEAKAVIAEQLEDVPKWSETTHKSLGGVVRHLGNSIASVALRVNRTNPKWHAFWDDGKHAVREVRRQVQPRRGVQHRGRSHRERWQFLEPAMQARIGCYTECHSRVMAEVVRRVIPGVLNQNGLWIVELAGVFDADFQGKDNCDLFQSIWESEHPSLDEALRHRLGYKLDMSSVRLSTEEDEPCLLLADYLAGIVQAYRGETPRPQGVSEADLRGAFASLEASRTMVESEVGFELSFPAIMASSPLRGFIWPDSPA